MVQQHFQSRYKSIATGATNIYGAPTMPRLYRGFWVCIKSAGQTLFLWGSHASERNREN